MAMVQLICLSAMVFGLPWWYLEHVHFDREGWSAMLRLEVSLTIMNFCHAVLCSLVTIHVLWRNITVALEVVGLNDVLVLGKSENAMNYETPGTQRALALTIGYLLVEFAMQARLALRNPTAFEKYLTIPQKKQWIVFHGAIALSFLIAYIGKTGQLIGLWGNLGEVATIFLHADSLGYLLEIQSLRRRTPKWVTVSWWMTRACPLLGCTVWALQNVDAKDPWQLIQLGSLVFVGMYNYQTKK